MSEQRLDIYLLKGRTRAEAHTFIAKLAGKSWRSGLKTVIWCDTEAEARVLDGVLWEVPPDAFLPHHLITEGPDLPVILLAFPGSPIPVSGCLVLTGATVPDQLNTERVALVAANDEAALQASRKRYREFQQQGYTAQVHDLRES